VVKGGQFALVVGDNDGRSSRTIEVARIHSHAAVGVAAFIARDTGKGKFENATPAMSAEFRRPVVARGAAYADIDHDGDLDLLVTTNDGPAYLFRNDGGNRNHWLTIRTVGAKSNRDGIGAIVRVESKSGKQWNRVRSGSSYCSQSDLALTFGLGSDTVANIEVEWPSGITQKLANVPSNQFLTIDESRGLMPPARPRRTQPPL
jgi:hypothetical protein